MFFVLFKKHLYLDCILHARNESFNDMRMTCCTYNGDLFELFFEGWLEKDEIAFNFFVGGSIQDPT